MSVKRRIATALAANAFGQAVTVVSQLLLPPLFFRFWGAPLYGEWLLLSSIPAYLAMADVGIGSAAGNEMVMRAGAGDRRGAQATFLGALWVATIAAAVVVVVGAVAAALCGLWHWPATPHMASTDAAYILLLLAVGVAMGFAGSVLSAGFRSSERNALGISLSNAGRLLEVVLTAVLLLCQMPPLLICATFIAVRLLMLGLQALWLRRVGGWLFAPGARADRQLVRRLVRPALGFMAFPLGNALVLQGPLMIIGATMGGAGVAMFSSLRTLARVPMQVTNMFNSSIWPELSRAHGAGNLELLRRMHRISWLTNLLLILPMALGQIILGQWVVRHWLGAAAPYDAGVFGALVMITAISVIWNASSVVLAAINMHAKLGRDYLATSAIGLSAAALCSSFGGWASLLVPQLLAEVVLLYLVLPTVLRLTGDCCGDFYRGIVWELHRLVRR